MPANISHAGLGKQGEDTELDIGALRGKLLRFRLDGQRRIADGSGHIADTLGFFLPGKAQRKLRQIEIGASVTCGLEDAGEREDLSFFSHLPNLPTSAWSSGGANPEWASLRCWTSSKLLLYRPSMRFSVVAMAMRIHF